jgi:hypothetical protein
MLQALSDVKLQMQQVTRDIQVTSQYFLIALVSPAQVIAHQAGHGIVP